MSDGDVIRASAPGKLFLLGEYAVLAGAPALLTAVDSRAAVTLRVPDQAAAGWRLTAPAIGLADFPLGPDGAMPTGLDAADRERLRVFDAVRRTVAEAVPATRAGTGCTETAPHGLSITIDTASFWHDSHKLGLGSSAAVAAALTAALARVHRLELSADELRSCATRAHRAAQGGAGSGGDVAASCTGGLIGFRRGAVGDEQDPPPRPLSWPQGLDLRVVATGTGSSSSELVGRVAAYGRRDPHAHAADLGRLAVLAGRAAAALASTDAFLRLADDYFLALAELDAHADAGIITPRHRALRRLAAAHGGVFKTSGAGGGDIGLIFSRRGAASLAIDAAMAAEGVSPVPLQFGGPGVRVDGAGETGDSEDAS